MATEYDPAEKFQDYAHPHMLVSTEWLEKHLDDSDVVIVESDEDVLLYETGHIPGAVKVDWHTDLQDPVARDYLDGEGFARLMSEKGVARDHTVVFYGDNFNWWAAYALWVFTLFGHPDVRLLDGGRQKWLAEERPTTTEAASRPRSDYPVVTRRDDPIRAFRRPSGRWWTSALPRSTRARRSTCPSTPKKAPSAVDTSPGRPVVPWKQAANDDGT